MRCLRCGYCCKHYYVIIVDDPDKGLCQDNLKFHKGDGTPCQHLRGNKPGEIASAIHERSWYKDTPCFAHGQIESNINEPCRVGTYIIERITKDENARAH